MEQQTTILLCEDDENLGVLLKEYLMAKGLRVELQPDGEAGLRAFTKDKFDICVLDVMMPKKDGITLAKDIRNLNSDVPIIFLTAKSMKEDILEGFKAGADDYLSKPFSMEELLARLNATMRRSFNEDRPDKNVFRIGNFTFDYVHQTLTLGNEVQRLTAKECDLLRIFAVNFNQLVDRNTTLQKIWKDDSYFAARSMDVYITKLRKYLKADPTVEIVNVHGVGFKLSHKEN
jgi:DNA-binding response OmpR family regulator